MEKLYTRQELADYLQVTVSTLDRYSIPRVILGDRLVRYRESDVIRYLEEKKQVREKIVLPRAPELVLCPVRKHSRRKSKSPDWLPRPKSNNDSWLKKRLKELDEGGHDQ